MKYLGSTRVVFSIFIVLLAGCGSDNDVNSGEDFNDKTYNEITGRWVYGDMHVHSTASDGHNILPTVLDKAFNEFGASYIASTDHSGFSAYKINEELTRTTIDGKLILNPDVSEELHSHDYAKEFYPDDKGSIDRSIQINTLYSHVQDYRETLKEGQYLLQGMEWTIPYTNEHATLLILDEGNVGLLTDFHDRFAKGNGNSKALEDNLDAARALENDFNGQAIFAFNHPSRKHKVAIEDIRLFHNAAPNAFIGMEGAPGHQRNEEARGSYEQVQPIIMEEYADYGVAYNGQTYGGFDYMTAKLGGVWDALLSEGRHFSIITQSDFHSVNKDFWPNQYAKTHLFLETQSDEGIIAALKKGSAYLTHGDLISDLNFKVISDEEVAYLGDELIITSGSQLVISIELLIPEMNHNADHPDLAFVDIIAGDITGVKDQQDSDFNKPFSDSAHVMASFSKDGDGWVTDGNKLSLSFTLTDVNQSMYFRLRGSNNPKGTQGYVDELGNPIIDSEKSGVSVEAMAWNDLWFYSNPIYVTVR